MQIAPGIHNVITEKEMTSGVTNTYLVIGRSGALWVDAGWDRPGEAEARINYWKQLGSPKLLGIAVTHRHPPHWGNAPAIQKAAGGDAPIIATPVEKGPMEERMAGAKVGKAAADGETLDLGGLTAEFVHAPGHTYGSLAVFLREPRALFTGDTIMGVGTSVVNPGEGEIGLFLQTMDKFLRYNPSVIYPGQGPIVTDPRAKINELIQHRKEREQQIVAQLQKGPQTVDGLVGALYTGLNERLTNLAKNQVKSHLIKLEKEGKAAASGESYRLK